MSATDPHHATHRTIEAVWRIESARVIAGLTRLTRDVGLAEDLAQEALVAALEQWPQSGVPDNPAAWLTATAKRRAIDLFRRNAVAERKHEELARELEALEQTSPDLDSTLDNTISDDLLRLIFIACHPILPTESRAALTLRLLGGLTTDEIARAFLTPEPTIAQRIVRAKRTLADKHIPFEVPRGPELAARLSSVLEVIYLIFNEGYSATTGDDLMRPILCEDALRLGRILAELTPTESEVHGLVALMEIQASRTRVRITSTGEPVLLFDQNRTQWDQLLIHRGLTAIERAHKVNTTRGPYLLQAEIAACHARARTPSQTDWHRIVNLYIELAQLSPSPVIELNRAVAVSMAYGPHAGLTLVDALASEPSLARYHLLPSVRADLLYKLGRHREARAEFERAAALTRNTRERDLLLTRAASCKTHRTNP
ncbi:RNA polymerase sigma factor [Tunturiibacter gelidoferens]|jgi:RNA polymerase sigma factor (sigma-70 family)|uniref:RNA polymerase sigma factor (Sigma-70 family) n=1 Tax=Tunturiibacter gelidiferens TaxID=3069689 RepID=A0A9X0QG58_9BACT|nr:RNA polymerase sigma factor [Edaphobacter lichenicola]MBB5329851.1 RNA polymerase sigma factor (sigma-70 family) [Edaphobacter lichenicola]